MMKSSSSGFAEDARPSKMDLSSATSPMTPEAVLRVVSSAAVASNASGTQNPAELIRAMKKLPGMLTSHAIHMDAIVSHVVRLIASHNAEVKAMACDLVCAAASDNRPEVALLAANILNQDLADPNPEIRCVAVATLCSMPMLAEQHAIQAITLALKDSNPRVRKSGVTGCGKVFSHSPEVVRENNLVDKLYQQIKDADPTVLSFTMQTLNYILEEEGGIVINNAMAKYLVKRLDDLPDPELCFVLDYLNTHYCSTPRATSSDVLATLSEETDKRLESKSPAVLLCACKLSLAIANQTQENGGLQALAARIKPLLSRFLRPTSQPHGQDFQIQLLDWFLSVRKEQVGALLSGFGAELHVHPKDATALRLKKVEAMCHVCSGSGSEFAANAMQYLLETMQNEADETVRKNVLDALCRLCKRFPVHSNVLLRELSDLLDFACDRFCCLVLGVIRHLPLSATSGKDNKVHAVDPSVASAVLDKLCVRAMRDLGRSRRPRENDDHAAKVSVQVSGVLWILANQCHLVADAPYYLEHVVETEAALLMPAPMLQLLLLAGVRVFAHYPAAAQHTLGAIFELCSRKGGVQLRKRLNLYAGILQDQQLTEELIVIQGSQV